MPAFLYQRSTTGGKRYLNQVRQISLAGFGALHSLWSSEGKPIDKGWYITAAGLIVYAIGANGKVGDHEIIIDAAPSVKSLVDLVQVVDIHVYTHGNDAGGASWSNLMLRVKDVCWEEGVTPDKKTALTKRFEEPSVYGEDILTFLYLHGDARSWNFGRIGQMNGAWLHSQARDYFRRFF